MAAASGALGSGGAVDPETLYTKQACIGGGSFGKVYKGVDKRTGELVAIKVIDVENAEDEVDDIIQEISILSGLHSPYVTKYHGSYLKGSDLWIIMEYCSGGSCGNLLRPGLISEDYICIIVRELLMGLEYLHSDNKLHRDIKAANVLLGANGQVKLADFGVSGQLSATMTKKNTFVGTPFWMAPEVIKQSGYDHKADIWSLGITALELALGEPPYSDIHPMKVLFLIPKNPPPVLDGHFSDLFKDFISQCLKKEPKERPSAKELLRHSWLKRGKKTAYLTELIERYERWQARHGHREDDEEDMQEDQAPSTPEDEDLWDFGTVRPAGRRNAGLKVMNEAATNSRNHASQPSSPQRSPVKQQQQQQPPPSWTGEDAENVGGRTIKGNSPVKSSGNMALPPLSTQGTPIRQLNPPLTMAPSPGTAARVPLPPSPTRRPGSSNLPQTPRAVPRTPEDTPSAQLRSYEETPQLMNDDFLQQSIANDMSRYMNDLSINDQAQQDAITPAPPVQGPSRLTPRSDGSRSLKIKRSVGTEGRPVPFQTKLQQSLSVSTTQTVPPTSRDSPVSSQHAQPETSNVQPSGIYGSDTSADSSRSASPFMVTSHASSDSSTSQHNQQAPQRHHQQPQHAPQQSPEQSITALSGVVIPALEAALHRRTHQLSLLQKSSQKQHNANPPSTQDLLLKRQAHEQIRKLVGKVARLCRDIDHWDGVAPVGMGDGVEGYLEGFLEEILCRVEAEDA